MRGRLVKLPGTNHKEFSRLRKPMNRPFPLTIIALTLLALNSSSFAQANHPALAATKPKSGPGPRVKLSTELLDSLESHEGLTYATYGDRTLQLDLYRPKAAAGKSLPAIVCVHGGGWGKGERKHHATLAKALAHRGYVAVTISYRLSGEAIFPAQIHDCKAAIRWLRAHTKQYGVNADKIGAAGLSAGGHLVALLATSNDVPELEGNGGNPEQSSTIQAAVPMGAQTHFMSERNREISAAKEIWQAFLGGSQAEQPERYRLASPLTHLDANDPPVLLLSGEFDDPSTHAEEFRAKMKKLGLTTGYISVPNAPHGFLNQQKHFDFCIETTAAFFDEHLGAGSAE
jgi:pectinesterase